MDGRTAAGLFIDPALPWGSTSPDLRAAGVSRVNLVDVTTRASLPHAPDDVCPEQPCHGNWVCCSFVGCNGRVVQICSTGACVYGSDGCGECFVCG
jgi:hypothetical protein